VKGIVTNEINKAIPNVNITFNGSKESVSSNLSGIFYLKSKNNYTEISFSSVGYENKTISLKQLITTDLKVMLKLSSTSLNEVVLVRNPKKRLKKKENPAYRILESVWKNKKKNGLKLVKFYQYEKYSNIEMGINNLDSLFIKKVFKKDFDTLVLKIKMDDNNSKFTIPVKLIEKTEKIYGDNILKKEHISIEGKREQGVDLKGKIFDRIENAFQEIDVYDNNFTILNKNFVSPISTAGFGTYDYVLADSTEVNEIKYYSIYFFPRDSRDFAFKGNFTVADKSFALTDIQMRSPKKMNMNFVRNFEFKKTYTIQKDSIYLEKTNEYKGDFTLLSKDEDEKGIYVVKKETFSNYQFDVQKEAAFFNVKEIQTNAKQYEKDNSYWNTKHDEQTATTYKMVDKVKDSQKIKSLSGGIYILSDGYLNLFKGLQTGNIWATAAKNDVEGVRIRAGFRTYKSDNDPYRIEGFTAYGFKDQLLKIGLESRYLFSTNPRIIISMAYLNDTEQMGLSQFNGVHLLPEADKGAKALVNRGNNFFLSRIEKTMFRIDTEPIRNLHVGLTFSHNLIQSAAPRLFSIDYYDYRKSKIRSRTTDVVTDLYLTYTPRKEESGFGVDLKESPNLHPILMFNYRRGYQNLFGGSFNYNRIQILYNNPISLGKFGVFDATLAAGKTFEATPLSIMTSISSNQTYFLLPNTFALLDYYEFVADTYVEGHFEQHFNGLLMNRIPLIKKLNLRSLLTFRGVYGTISNASKEINRSSIIYVAPTKPYYEYGFGFENIGFGNIRPFRLDFIWRSNFVNFNGPINPNFGIRLGVKTVF